MNPQTWWWLENTSTGRRVQQRILPPSALGPKAREDLREQQKEDERLRELRRRKR